MQTYELPYAIRWTGMIIGKLISAGAFIIGIATPILAVVALVMLIKYLRKKNREP